VLHDVDLLLHIPILLPTLGRLVAERPASACWAEPRSDLWPGYGIAMTVGIGSHRASHVLEMVVKQVESCDRLGSLKIVICLIYIADYSVQGHMILALHRNAGGLKSSNEVAVGSKAQTTPGWSYYPETAVS